MATLLYEWKIEDISASDNDPIGTWTSHAGGVAFSQAVSGNKPLYKTNVTPSGKAVLRGDGINDSMTSPSITGVVHLFVVGAFRPSSNSAYPELLETYGHDDFLVFAGSLNFAPVGTHYRNGINSLAVYPDGQFAIYEAVRSSPATGVLNLLHNSVGNEGPFDVAYVAAYDAEVTGGALTTIRGALQAAYLNPPAPTITTTSPLPGGVADGSAYSTTLEATGGAGSLTWSTTSGDLPDGWYLNPFTGVISGSLDDAGTFTFTVVATDENDISSDPVEFTLTITALHGATTWSQAGTIQESCCGDPSGVPGGSLFPVQSAKILDDFWNLVAGTSGYFTMKDTRTGIVWRRVRFEGAMERDHINWRTIQSRDMTLVWKPCCATAPMGGVCVHNTTGRDVYPPTVPILDPVTIVSDTAIDLAWSKSVDNVGVRFYEVSRDDVILNAGNVLIYRDTGLDPDTTYEYKVRAVDFSGNRSAWSNAESGTTDA